MESAFREDDLQAREGTVRERDDGDRPRSRMENGSMSDAPWRFRATLRVNNRRKFRRTAPLAGRGFIRFGLI